MKYLIGILAILALVLWAWAVYDVNATRIKKKYNHTLWLLLILIFPILGPLAYFQLKKRL